MSLYPEGPGPSPRDSHTQAQGETGELAGTCEKGSEEKAYIFEQKKKKKNSQILVTGEPLRITRKEDKRQLLHSGRGGERRERKATAISKKKKGNTLYSK